MLKDMIDIHIHTNPDVRYRRYDDIGIAKEAALEGARAIVIKSHVAPTVGRAYLASQCVSEVDVFGGIVLNNAVGGINPIAVKSAIDMGAKFVWLPTKDGKSIQLFDGNQPIEALTEVLELISSANIALGTGHIRNEDLMRIVPLASEMGVNKIVINHPEKLNAFVSLEDQVLLSKTEGVYFERCYSENRGDGYKVNFNRNLESILEVGVTSTILATDGGQVENPSWKDMMANQIEFLMSYGIKEEEIEIMTKINPGKVLGLR